MSDLQHTLDRLQSLPRFAAERPATQEDIQRIQSDLGVILPEQYVEFLQRFGYVRWFGQEILGIRPIDPETGAPSTETSDCIAQTKQERDPGNPLGTSSLPPEHVVIKTDGGGGNFVLFTEGSSLDGQVHWYNLEDGEDPIMTWPSFQAFLEYLISRKRKAE